MRCPRCQGRGEVPVPGTFGATVSPEHLDLVECPLCHGDTEVTQQVADRFFVGK